MRHESPSQARVVLLLIASLTAGMLVATAVGPRDQPSRQAQALPLNEHLLVVESP